MTHTLPESGGPYRATPLAERLPFAAKPKTRLVRRVPCAAAVEAGRRYQARTGRPIEGDGCCHGNCDGHFFGVAVREVIE